MPNLKHKDTVRQVGGALLATGAVLAASALYAQLRTRQAERNNPPQGEFIDIDRVRLHYIDRGTGPVVVLVHGNGSMIRDFELSGIVDRLAQTNRVIVFDRPGYGHSDRPDFRNFDPRSQAALLRRALLRLHVEDPVIVGHSWGTLVALWMGIMHPNAIRGQSFPGRSSQEIHSPGCPRSPLSLGTFTEPTSVCMPALTVRIT